MLSVYNYQDGVKYLSDYLRQLKLEKADFSIKKWSQEAGFPSSAHVIDILKGKKALRPQQVSQFIDKIGLDETEHTYFMALVSKGRADSQLEERVFDLFLNDVTPKNKESFQVMRTSEMDLFSHWIFTTILTMTELKNFDLNALNVKNALREDVAIEVIEMAIQKLFELELLEKKEGRIFRRYDFISTKTGTSHESVKNYYAQMAELSKKAYELPADQREFQSFSIALEKDQMPLAKDIIRKCRQNLSSLGSLSGDKVYQMNIFFFPLTEDES